MKKQAQAVKTFKNRDTATALLKKLGIAKADYKRFIVATADGKFECQVAKAQMYLLPTTKSKKAKGNKKVTVSAVARQLILAGKANDAVWAALQAQFGLDEKKKSYPAWYRAQLRRDGLLAKQN